MLSMGGSGFLWILMAVLVTGVGGGSMWILEGFKKDAYNVESRVTLECDEKGVSAGEGVLLTACHGTLSDFTQQNGIGVFNTAGSALPHGDVIPGKPQEWPAMYFEGPRGWVNTGVLLNPMDTVSCKRQTQLCLRRLTCTMHEEFWGNTPRSRDAKIKLSKQDGGEQFAPQAKVCVMCAPTACSDAELSCPNGRMASSESGQEVEPQSATMGTNGLPARFVKPKCGSSCPVGTWLTCGDEAACWYVAPSAETIRAVLGGQRGPMDVETRRWMQRNRVAKSDLTVSLDLGVPVDRCYPCHLAANLKHFGRRVSTDAVLLGQGYLQFECPGGSLGPRMCGSNEVSQIQAGASGGSPCQCKPGWFRDGQGVCQPCEAGHRCRFGATAASGMEACPVDTFSSGGSTECVACRKDAGRCGAHEALTRCSGAGFQGRDSVCVDCSECIEVSGRQVPGTKPCLHLV